jgi:hypothetical protein
MNDEDYADFAPDCLDCDKSHKDRVYAREFFNAVLKQLYSKLPLDKEELENDLDELCSYFELKIPLGKLQIERGENE